MSASTFSVRIGSRSIEFGPPIVMGVVNVTPDSFSGDGLHLDAEEAVRMGADMVASGAELIDIGGESTRPGAEAVSSKEELRRTAEVVSRLSQMHPGRISIDTTKPDVADAALCAGASIVNDVSGLRDAQMRRVAAQHGASVIIMHMQGDPRTMQKSPQYGDVVNDIAEYLSDRVAIAEADGISGDRIMIDPGIGFGKTLEHNIEILARLRELRNIGKPIVIGVSRKSFLGALTGAPVSERLGPSLVAAALATVNSANIIRAHDVAENVQALKIAWQVSSRARNQV